MTISIEAVYIPSDDVVAREIEGELIIVPLVAGIGDMEDELFTLNETGKAVWKRLDGKENLAVSWQPWPRCMRPNQTKSSTMCAAWWRSWSGGGCWLRPQRFEAPRLSS